MNCPERITYQRLSEVCARRAAQVNVKVRLADVLPIEGSGLSQDLYQFALQAHYDFVITDLAQHPLFAVEFDGPSHGHPAQVARDDKKDELSHRFRLPLSRFVAEDLHRSESRLDRLTEVIEQWFEGREAELVVRLAAQNNLATPPISQGVPIVGKPVCPQCGSGLVVKDGRYGPFLSCVRYPACRGSRDLPPPIHRPVPQLDGALVPTVVRTPNPWLTARFMYRCRIAILLLFVVTVGMLIFSMLRSETNKTTVVNPAPVADIANPATSRQIAFLNSLIKHHGWDTAERNTETSRVLGYSRAYSELSKQEASKLITAWDNRGK